MRLLQASQWAAVNWLASDTQPSPRPPPVRPADDPDLDPGEANTRKDEEKRHDLGSMPIRSPEVPLHQGITRHDHQKHGQRNERRGPAISEGDSESENRQQKKRIPEERLRHRSRLKRGDDIPREGRKE